MSPKFAHASSNHDILLENDALRITIDSRTGAFVGIENKLSSLSLIQHPSSGIPFRLERSENTSWDDRYVRFTWEYDTHYREGKLVSLVWVLEDDIRIECRVELPQTDPNVYLWLNVVNEGTSPIDKIEFPVIDGIGSLGNQSALAHSQGTGFLFHDPFNLFEYTVNSSTDRIAHNAPNPRQGIRYSPYIEGFNGSPTQFMTYYNENGGFYFAAYDATNALKWLNFFKTPANGLSTTFMHQCPDIGPGKGWFPGYPVVIGALTSGQWYEAADRYKTWTIEQDWADKGPLWSRTDKCTWLLEEVGFCTFGINSLFDRSAWLDFFHHITDQPVFHVMGVNWSKGGGDYRNNFPGGRDDWFPAHFNPANLETIRSNGDYWAPFEFDLLFASKGQDSELITAARQVFPQKTYSFAQYPFPFLCPTTEFLREIHAWRDARLVSEYGADGLYYDISVNTLLMNCRNPLHHHPIGGGHWLVEAYKQLYRNTKEAANEAHGSYVPQGTECMNEPFIPYLDFYQARAEASPLSIFEADMFREWIKTGRAEKIPLFTYLYHEYGPVRMDGWAKLSREVGELFYWVASRVTLWGGLFQLNYEFSDLERLDGLREDPLEHYYSFERRGYEIDPEKVAFVREIALARTGFANPYLAYGKMLRPLDISTPMIDLDYFLYNGFREAPHYEEQGTMRVPAVLHSAWLYRDERLGYLFINLNRDTPLEVEVQADVTGSGLRAKTSYQGEIITLEGNQAQPVTFNGRHRFTLTLPARRVVLLEIT